MLRTGSGDVGDSLLRFSPEMSLISSFKAFGCFDPGDLLCCEACVASLIYGTETFSSVFALFILCLW